MSPSRERQSPVPDGVRVRADYVLTECIKDDLGQATKDRIIRALWRHNLLARVRSALAGDQARHEIPDADGGL